MQTPNIKTEKKSILGTDYMHWHTILLWGMLPILSTAAEKDEPNCPPRSANLAAKRRIFDDFIQKLYINKEYTQALTDHVSVEYINHNPFVLNGRDAAIAFFQQPFFQVAVTDVLRTAVDGDLAVIHRRSQLPGAPLVAGVDIYRFDGTCIVEHWDVIQALPANATNPNPLF